MNEFIEGIADHKACIFGLQGSGKTELAKHIMKLNPRFFAYDVTGDFKGMNQYVPDDVTSVQELDDFIGMVLKKNNKIRGIIIDEADNYFPPNARLLPNAAELITKHRHYKLTAIFITRRPTDIMPKIRDTSKNLFSFSQKGLGSIKIFNEMHEGMGDAVSELEFEGYKFMVYNPKDGFKVHEKIFPK